MGVLLGCPRNKIWRSRWQLLLSPVMFRLSQEPFDPAALQRALADVRAGACVTFEGWVRNRNEGQPVLALDYEAYPLLAQKEGERIVAEAREKFAVLAAHCIHRVGHLPLGELAVWV